MTINELRRSVESRWQVDYLDPDEYQERLNTALISVGEIYGVRESISVPNSQMPTALPPEAVTRSAVARTSDGQAMPYMEIDRDTRIMTFKVPRSLQNPYNSRRLDWGINYHGVPGTETWVGILYPIKVTYNIDLTLVDPDTWQLPTGVANMLSKCYYAHIALLYHQRDRAAKNAALLPIDDIPSTETLTDNISKIDDEMEERGGYVDLVIVGG